MKNIVLKLLSLLFTTIVLSSSTLANEQNIFEDYMKNINKELKGNWVSPLRDPYEANLSAKIGKNGNILDAKINKSSGDKKLDESMINSVKKIKFNPLPSEYKNNYIDISFVFTNNPSEASGYTSSCVFLKTQEEKEFFKNLSEEKKDIYNQYLKTLKAELKKNMDISYSYINKSVVISYIINNAGKITDIKLEKTSGSEAYDRLILNFFENSILPPLSNQLELGQLKLKCKIIRTYY